MTTASCSFTALRMGVAIYFLRHDLKSAKAAFEQAPADGTVDDAVAILAQAELEEDELDEFAAFVSKNAGGACGPLEQD